MNVLRADMLKFKKSMALKVLFLISGQEQSSWSSWPVCSGTVLLA